MPKAKNRTASGLRAAAEKALLSNIPQEKLVNEPELAEVLQELQVHQIELEMQNDELRIANEQTELQRLRFEGIYDLAPVGYFILNYNGGINEVNTAGIKLLEHSKGALRGKNLQSFVAEKHRDDFHRYFRSLLATNEQQRCQLKFVSGAGHEFYALLEGRAVPVSTTCYIAMIDATENTESRLSLAEIKDHLELALAASNAGTWQLSVPSMQFIMDEINHKICNAVEGNFDETYASFIGLVHPGDRYAVDQHFRTAANTNSEIDTISRFISHSGEVCFANIRGRRVSSSTGSEKRFVGIMWDITGKKKEEARAEQEKIERQKEITMAAMEAEEKERKRISEALHDSVSQLLYGIKIQLDHLDDRAKPAVGKLSELLHLAIRETRNISFELAPSTLTDFGLPATLSELCDRLSTPQMRITASFTGPNKRGSLLLETTVFRIIQELINNCMKHSGASQVRVQLKRAKLIEITVQDNGRGFDTDSLRYKLSGAGIASIRNRVLIYNGKLTIDSRLGGGTTVKVVLDNAK